MLPGSCSFCLLHSNRVFVSISELVDWSTSLHVKRDVSPGAALAAFGVISAAGCLSSETAGTTAIKVLSSTYSPSEPVARHMK